jgi:cytochrome b561
VAARVMHWCTLLAVIASVVLALSRDWVDDDDLTDTLLNAHRYAGLAVLALTLLRLSIRLTATAPDHGLTRWQRLAATATHHLLYLLLLGMPIMGWLTSNAHGVALKIGPIALPTLLARNHDLGDVLGKIHELGAWVFLGLIGLHAAAALYHHWMLRDGVLTSMLRGRSTRP